MCLLLVLLVNWSHMKPAIGPFLCVILKVRVKSILRIVCKRIINVRNALLKHVTKTVKYVVLNCGVRPLNSFSPFSWSGFFWAGLNQDSMTQSSHRARPLSQTYVRLEAGLQTDQCEIKVQWELQRADAPDAFQSLSRYFDVTHWSSAALLTHLITRAH